MSTVLLTHVQFHEPPQMQMKNHLHGWECSFEQDDTFQWLERNLWEIPRVPENEQVWKGNVVRSSRTNIYLLLWHKYSWSGLLKRPLPQTFNNVHPHLRNRWKQPVEQIKTLFLVHQENCCYLWDHPAIAFSKYMRQQGKRTPHAAALQLMRSSVQFQPPGNTWAKPQPCADSRSGQPKRNGKALRCIRSSEQTWSHRRQSLEKRKKWTALGPAVPHLCNNISWQSCWNMPTALETF